METIDKGFVVTLVMLTLLLIPFSIWFLRRKVWGPRLGPRNMAKLKVVK
jgi:hypothetical protein